MNNLKELENEELINKLEQEFEKNRKIAVKWGWNFSKFKKFFTRFLSPMTEEQWLDDYHAYCDMCGWKPDRYVHPLEFGELYYEDRWNKDKVKKAIESLKRTVLNK